MKKRVMSLWIAVIFCILALPGCKKNVGTSEDNAMRNDEETEDIDGSYLFGFSCITMENPYYITLEQSLRETIEDRGHSLITKDPRLDADRQLEQLEEMIEEGVDAVFLCPVSWEKITPALEKLKEADVRIINVDTEVKAMDYVDAYVGSDNKNAGVICAQDLIKMYPDGGKIVILESLSQNSVIDRITGFEEAIAGQGFEIVARADVHGDLNDAREAASEIFKENEEITAVMCGNDPSALGALVAANTAKRKDLIIYGVDGSPDLKKELIKHDTLIRGTCGQSPISTGKDAAKIGIALLDGEDYERETYEEVFFIDAENVKMYGADGWQ
ncbi:MAG: sugar ABC transporter substrate-binding protein [Coprococcus sp.]|nr:sugar ABC transporter substrate-binding protein [Coprococcus sp.]